MFSTTIKRSVATLGVVAGLLAAAVPASAGPVGVPAGGENDALQLKAGQDGSEGGKYQPPGPKQSFVDIFFHELIDG